MPISDSDWEAIVPYLSTVAFGADEIILQPPKVCAFIAFIRAGSMRSYHVDDQLTETNLLLKGKFEFITDYESFISQTPATLWIRSIESGSMILLEREGLHKLYETSFYWNKFGRIISEQIFLNSKRRTEELLFLTPKERYLLLMRTQPEFFQRYSLKDIASYLGVTPQSLSRIRNQLTKH